ncbi:MAG: hypothetical protein ACSLEM_06540 [Candidatus Malihini olakiniferum]
MQCNSASFVAHPAGDAYRKSTTQALIKFLLGAGEIAQYGST